jgi:hypothetical protein
MAMMKCPHCGADNSEKRDYCYQCEGELRGKAKESHGYVENCRSCSKANMFPPPGTVVTRDQVWCLDKGQVVSATMVAGACFEEAFGWSRDKILD